MAVEAKRCCGYRKVGGIYMVGDGYDTSCSMLPYHLHVCPTCGGGIKQAMGYTWILPAELFPKAAECKQVSATHECPLTIPGKHGLMWVGKGFYSPQSFSAEAIKMGISKRIGSIPRWFEIGKTWVFLAHPEAGSKEAKQPDGSIKTVPCPGVFYIFKPSRIEKIVTQTQSEDAMEMKKLGLRGITPVIVPDNDPDHQGTVYMKVKPVVAP